MPTTTACADIHNGGDRKKGWADVFSSLPSSKAKAFRQPTPVSNPAFSSQERGVQLGMAAAHSQIRFPVASPAPSQGTGSGADTGDESGGSCLRTQSMVIVSADQTRKGRPLAFPRRPSRCGGTGMAALPAADLFLLPGVPTEVSPGRLQELLRGF